MRYLCYFALVFIHILFLNFDVFANHLILQSTVDQHNHNAYSLAKCILQIPNIQFTTVLFSSNNTEVTDVETFSNDMIEILLSIIPVMTSKDLDYIKNQTIINSLATLVVMHVRDCDDLSNIDVAFIKHYIKYVLIIHDYSDVDCQSKLVGLPSEFARYNVVFIVPESNGVHKILSYIPEIDSKTCDYSTALPPEHINTCTKGYLKGSVVFQDKMIKNMKRCTIRVGVMHNIPFLIVKSWHTRNLTEPVNATGMDMEIMKIIAAQHNISVYTFMSTTKRDLVSQRVATKESDMEIGGYSRHEFTTKGILNTVNYATSNMIWLYPVKRTERDWREFATKVNGLYLFGIFYVIYCLLFNFVRYVDGQKLSFSDTFLYSWGALLGTNSLQDPRSFKQSILNMFYLYMCLHLSAYVSTQLSAFLAVNTPSELYKTHDDIIQAGRPPFFHTHFLNLVPTDKFRAYGMSYHHCVVNVCEPLALANDGVAITFENMYYTYSISKPVNGMARMLKTEPLFYIGLNMIIGEHNIMAPNILNTLERLVNSGITPMLFENSLGIGVKARVDKSMKAAAINDYSCESGCRITLTHLWPAFFFWLLGSSLAACVFLGEVLWNKFGYIYTFVDR